MYELDDYEFNTAWRIPAKITCRRGSNDRLTAFAVLVADEYDSTKLATYKEDDVFIDVGSHIGTWSVLMGIKYPQATIMCFEPIPENFQIILLNKAANNLERLHPYMLAVSDLSDSEESIFYTNDDTKFGREHRFVGSMLGGEGKEIKVPSISLNDILDSVQSCRILKIDCEGCESKGFSTLTHENFKKIEYIVGEFHPWTMDFKTFYGLFKRTHNDISKEEGNTNLRKFAFKRRDPIEQEEAKIKEPKSRW